MSTKVAQYLQQHVVGEVMTGEDALDYFSTDGSIFKVRPQIVAYPRNTADVRKVARFAWQLAEKGKVIPITARGKGTDQGGAALGEGIMLVFPAHMNRVMEIGKEDVTIQPGILYATLEQTLHTHGRFLPPYPSSADFCTVGGAIANNSAGEKTVKYGDTKKYVKSLHVVLANGELIKTERLSKRELNRKKGLTTFEGEIYRQLDGLLTDHADLIKTLRPHVSKNCAGYDLASIKHKDGSFDLTPLIVGSQGTLGIVTQAVLETVPYNPNTTLIAAFMDDLDSAAEAVEKIMPSEPSALEMVDEHLLTFLDKYNPKQLEGLVDKPYPKIVLLIEFDDISDRQQKRKLKRATKVLKNLAREYRVTVDPNERESLWKIRHSAAAVIWQSVGKLKALPIIEDGVVPRAKFVDYLKEVYKIYKKHQLEAAVWGHAGDANLHMQPFLDLSVLGDRQKVFKIADDYYNMVINLGGSTSGEHNDGRIRAPYLKKLLGDDGYALMEKVKDAFDPYKMLNPGVKIGVEQKELVTLLRKEYSMEHLYDHMPRS